VSSSVSQGFEAVQVPNRQGGLRYFSDFQALPDGWAIAPADDPGSVSNLALIKRQTPRQTYRQARDSKLLVR
jgi:hypothetical protein